MIFLTVGTQLPFDRLTSTIDAWCGRTGQGGKVFGQIGELGPENYRPEHFAWREMLDPGEFDQHVRDATLIVSHAGMGSIITAFLDQTPIIVLPRRADLGEQRNDHQLATIRMLGAWQGLLTVNREDEVPGMIERVMADGDPGGAVSPYADKRLLEAVRDFIQEDSMPPAGVAKPGLGGRVKKA